MPKKLSTNPKADEARQKKVEKKTAEKVKAEKAKEDAYWADDDPKIAKKNKQKEDEERKRLEQARKKAEAKELLDKEMSSIQTTAKIPQSKITRAQIDAEVEKRNRAIESLNQPQKPKPPKPVPVEENLSELNRAMYDMHVATNIDEAIAVLNSTADGKDDKHPEKRLKAAYKAYEDANLPMLKTQNPSLKLSQLKQIIFKNWQKAPENPMNAANN